MGFVLAVMYPTFDTMEHSRVYTPFYQYTVTSIIYPGELRGLHGDCPVNVPMLQLDVHSTRQRNQWFMTLKMQQGVPSNCNPSASFQTRGSEGRGKRPVASTKRALIPRFQTRSSQASAGALAWSKSPTETGSQAVPLPSSSCGGNAPPSPVPSSSNVCPSPGPIANHFASSYRATTSCPLAKDRAGQQSSVGYCMYEVETT